MKKMVKIYGGSDGYYYYLDGKRRGGFASREKAQADAKEMNRKRKARGEKKVATSQMPKAEDRFKQMGKTRLSKPSGRPFMVSDKRGEIREGFAKSEWFTLLKKKKGKEEPKRNYAYSTYTKPQIQIDREKKREERERKEKAAKDKAEKNRQRREQYEKTTEYKNNMKIREFAEKEREKYGVISCMECGNNSIPSPVVPKKCRVCGNKLEVEGRDFVLFIKPNEYKAGKHSNYDDGLRSIQLNPTDHPDVIDWEQ